MKPPKMTVEQELAAGLAIVRVGLERIRDAATRTEAVGPHIAALTTLYDSTQPDAGVLGAVADVIGTICVSVSEVEHADVERIQEWLDEAQGTVQDGAGERIGHALALLAPLAETDAR